MLRKSWLTLHPKSLAACLVLLGFTVGLFAYTVQARRPWFGKLSFEHHQWLTANTLRFARAWHAEGLENAIPRDGSAANAGAVGEYR